MNLFSSDTLLHTPTPMDQPPHHFSKPFPFFHPSFKNPDTNTNTDTNTDQSETTSSHEYMFEKPLTPSDVGKLNRLVIPKQHAEKHFPLASVASNGGVLLGFEDETGKCWKFRYSYWNSSQSYVLTKGWSRYVKDKKLDAGDVVLFQRHRFDSDRLFIGWRRRGSTSVHLNPVHHLGEPNQQHLSSSYRPNISLHAGTEVRQGGGQKGIKSGVGNSKRVRLFGVNLECQIQEEVEVEGEGKVVIEEPEIEMSQTISCGSPSSSHGQGQVYHAGSGFVVGPTGYNYFDYMGYPSNHHYNSHMDINFPQDVNQMSNSLR